VTEGEEMGWRSDLEGRKECEEMSDEMLVVKR
jgi:hypothetical protein